MTSERPTGRRASWRVKACVAFERHKAAWVLSHAAWYYAFNVARVRDWEQGRSKPDGALRAYLMVIERKPEAVDEALQVA